MRMKGICIGNESQLESQHKSLSFFYGCGRRRFKINWNVKSNYDE